MTRQAGWPASLNDEFLIAGRRVSALDLARARQQRAHTGSLLPVPPWDGLDVAEQNTAVLDAANWLRALANVAPEQVIGPD